MTAEAGHLSPGMNPWRGRSDNGTALHGLGCKLGISPCESHPRLEEDPH